LLRRAAEDGQRVRNHSIEMIERHATMTLRTRLFTSLFVTSLFAAFASAGCAANTDAGEDVESSSDELKGPGVFATDKRVPELGSDLTVLKQSKITMAKGLVEAEKIGPVIEAKFELDHSGKLALSLYPISEALTVDAQRQTFKELAGDPTKSPFQGNVETFTDQEHLTRSARDLTLIQLSKVTLAQAVNQVSHSGTVFWAIPTMRLGRAGYGLYTARNGSQKYHFVDGGGSWEHNFWNPQDLGTGPGSKATDQRHPELGENLQVLKQAKIKMSDALAEAEEHHGATIEAKYELEDGKLSLSIYPVGKGIHTDSERNTFFELAGDPTKTYFNPSKKEFTVPDAEHLTRSSRDLTLVQAAGFGLRTAVWFAEQAMPDGFVYWAIPTIRDTRAGYGIYMLGADGKAHYFFIS
jgi:hypothetical protein